MLVDENDHVDREGAARAGVGFYGKNTMLITRTHGSWVVLGTLVTDQAVEPTATARAGLRPVPPLHRRVPDGRARRARACSMRRAASPTGRRRLRRSRSAYREELGAMVYGCDICQDVCPWNRGVEKRRGGREPSRERGADRVATRLAGGGRRRAARALPAALRAAQRPSLAATERARRARQRRRAERRRRGGALPRRATTRCCARQPTWALARLAERGVQQSVASRPRRDAHERRRPAVRARPRAAQPDRGARWRSRRRSRAAGADISGGGAAPDARARRGGRPRRGTAARRPGALLRASGGRSTSRWCSRACAATGSRSTSNAWARGERRSGAAAAGAGQPRRERAAPRRSRDRSRAGERGDEVWIAVADDGPGVDAGARPVRARA